MSPRRLLHHLLCLTMLAVAARPVAAVETLRVLAWPGYADADMVKDFEQRHNARVDVTVVSSDDVLWQKVSNPSGNFDVVAANSVEIGRYIAHNRLLPLHLERIPNARGQRPRFRELQRIPGITQGAAVYAIPYTYAEMGLIYDRKQFATPPDSIAALWDPRLRGKVLAFDGSSHNFSLAAQHLRLAPFRLEEGEFNAAARDLGLKYSELIALLSRAHIELDRKVLALETEARRSAAWLGLRNVAFDAADVRSLYLLAAIGPGWLELAILALLEKQERYGGGGVGEPGGRPRRIQRRAFSS